MGSTTTFVLFATVLGAEAFAPMPGNSTPAPEPAVVCADPLGAVLAIMGCVEREDLACATAGYAKEFVKTHNGIVDPTTIALDEPRFWRGAFFFVDFAFTYNFRDHFDTNRVSLRYVESVKTLDVSDYTVPGLGKGPEQVEIVQHEHALITVNADCKMTQWDPATLTLTAALTLPPALAPTPTLTPTLNLTRWDQYGDNAEQTQVTLTLTLTPTPTPTLTLTG